LIDVLLSGECRPTTRLGSDYRAVVIGNVRTWDWFLSNLSGEKREAIDTPAVESKLGASAGALALFRAGDWAGRSTSLSASMTGWEGDRLQVVWGETRFREQGSGGVTFVYLPPLVRSIDLMQNDMLANALAGARRQVTDSEQFTGGAIRLQVDERRGTVLLGRGIEAQRQNKSGATLG
jgi:hypothetical protein